MSVKKLIFSSRVPLRRWVGSDLAPWCLASVWLLGGLWVAPHKAVAMRWAGNKRAPLLVRRFLCGMLSCEWISPAVNYEHMCLVVSGCVCMHLYAISYICTLSHTLSYCMLRCFDGSLIFHISNALLSCSDLLYFSLSLSLSIHLSLSLRPEWDSLVALFIRSATAGFSFLRPHLQSPDLFSLSKGKEKKINLRSSSILTVSIALNHSMVTVTIPIAKIQGQKKRGGMPRGVGPCRCPACSGAAFALPSRIG